MSFIRTLTDQVVDLRSRPAESRILVGFNLEPAFFWLPEDCTELQALLQESLNAGTSLRVRHDAFTGEILDAEHIEQAV